MKLHTELGRLCLNTFIGRSDSAVFTFKELFEEFEEINSVEPRLGTGKYIQNRGRYKK